MTVAEHAVRGERPREGRLPALDGLRGICAAIVVVHHTLLVAPRLAATYGGGDLPDSLSAYIMLRTPVHLLWAGGEAVRVFFVLSGFVLWKQMSGRPLADWIGYYPRRLVRLLLPVLGVTVLATLAAWLIDDGTHPRVSWWVSAHDVDPSVTGFVKDVVLLFGSSGMNSPLWSLQWELIFSLALPALTLLFRGARLRRHVMAVMALGAGVVAFTGGYAAGTYLPTFLAGSAIAAYERPVRSWLADRSASFWWAATLLAGVLLNAGWFPWAPPQPVGGLAPMAGAALTVLVFLSCPAAVRIGRTRWAQLLGTVSFSLYLVHVPIITTVAMLLNSNNPVVVGLLSMPMLVVVTWVAWRFFEVPALHSSRRVGLLVRDGWTRATGALASDGAGEASATIHLPREPDPAERSQPAEPPDRSVAVEARP